MTTTTYPPSREHFDATDIPERIRSVFEEAITCRANGCFRAAAIMVRRTLEELCSVKGATGRTLADRLSALRSQVVLPVELFSAAEELKTLGNDAAHLEARVYEEVGAAEIDAAIALCRELLKAVFQMQSLLTSLRSLRRPPQDSS